MRRNPRRRGVRQNRQVPPDGPARRDHQHRARYGRDPGPYAGQQVGGVPGRQVGLDRDAAREVEQDPGDRTEERGGDDGGRALGIGLDADALGPDQDLDGPAAARDLAVGRQNRQGAAGDLDRTGAGQPARQPVHGADELGDERGGGAFVQLGRGCALLQAARVEDGDPVGHGERLLLVVGDEDGGDPERELKAADLLPESEPDLGIECRERLVQQQHPGAQGERAGQGDALLLAAGHLVREAAAVVGQPDQVEEFGGGGVPLGGGHLPYARPEGHVVAGVQVREEAVGLEDHSGVAPVGGDASDVLAVDQDLAGVRLLEPGEHPQRGGLAAAGGAEEGEQFAGFDGEVEPVEGHGRAERAAQRAELDPGSGGGGR
ncbi:hypothetical protein SBADM41S_04734 [Streptomyces badius]